MRRSLLILLAVLATPVTAASASSLVSVDAPPSVLERLGLDVTHSGDVVLHDERDRAALRSSGYPATTLYEDLEAATLAARRASPRLAVLPSGQTDYRDLAEYESEIAALATGSPGLARAFDVGTSVQGRTIRGLEIAKDPGIEDGRPVLAIFGLHHAREWPSGEVVMEFAHDLVENYLDPGEDDVTALLDSVRLILVPVVNPDGFVYSTTTDASWRKNRGTPSVDLNRNYGAGWGGTGASRDPAASTYRGPAPFSEPESQAIHALSQRLQMTNVQAIHNIAGVVLRQPGFDEYNKPGEEPLTPDEAPMKALGDAMGSASGYASGTAFDFGEIHGATEDWNYIAQGAFGYTIELGPETSGMFQGPYATHVVGEYGGVREALLLAGAQAADTDEHGVITGTAPAGRTLKVRRKMRTGSLCTLECGALGVLGQFDDVVETTLTVPPGGTFTWHVNPSTRPWLAAAGGVEAWHLVCEDGGTVVSSRNVVVGRGQSVPVGDACDPAVREAEQAPKSWPAVPDAGGGGGGTTNTPPGGTPEPASPVAMPVPVPAPPRAVPAARLRASIARLRVRRATLRRRRALVFPLRLTGGSLRSVTITLRRAGRTVASRRLARIARTGRVRLPLRRIPAAGAYRLSVRGVSAAGAKVTATAAVQIRR